MKKITVIGTGYVGLVTGACLAEMGNHVTCLDIDHEKISSLCCGNLPFYEPGLNELVARCVDAGRLHFTAEYSEAIPGCDVCFLALPTPSKEDESCDLSYVLKAAEQLALSMDNYLVVVNKSTVPVGTAEKVREKINDTLTKRNVEIPFDIVSNPEFLCEGTAVTDCIKPDRILLGVDSNKARTIMRELYTPFSVDRAKIFEMDIPSAELAKYASNAMLATRISFMNHLAILSEKTGANIREVRRALGADKRIGSRYLNPGLGFGGSCLPKDVKALRSMAHEYHVSSSLLDSILEINQHQRAAFFEKIASYFSSLKEKTIALWGLSFKPNTDDLRDAPALYLIEKLLDQGASLRLYDPASMPKAKMLLKDLEGLHFCSDEYEAAEGADAIVLVTEWKQFKSVDFEKIQALLKNPVLFDGRNQYEQEEMEKLGFTYFCIGVSSSADLIYS
ncbi:MAG: UDP-glucose 6-dehydrogenase [Chlamydiae bacterium]|nr:UDP-glucose 6-dehydrogenase [Chlamydiota bacterium]